MKKIALSFFLFFAHSALASPESKINCSQVGDEITAGDFSYDDVERLIRCKNLTTVEELLERLPVKFRERFLLIYSSKSRHRESSVRSPRMIFTTPDARLIMGVAGHSSQENGNSIEFIENRGSKSEFSFHMITFPETSSAEVEFSEKNPTLCKGCHRPDLSPNWASYPLWPGAFGSGGIGSKEELAFKKFVNRVLSAKSNPRNNPKQAQSLAKEMDLMKRFKFLEGLKPDTHIVELTSRNHRFSQDIGYLNRKRIMDSLRDHPHVDRFSYFFSGANKKCANLEEFLPEELRASVGESLPRYFSRIKALTLANFNRDETQIFHEAGQYSSELRLSSDWLFFFAVERFIPVGYVMKNFLGIDPDDFTVTFKGTVYDSHHSLTGITWEFERYDWYNRSCGDLREASLKSLDGFPSSPSR